MDTPLPETPADAEPSPALAEAWQGNLVREARWLWMRRKGVSSKSIARREGVKIRFVQLGVARAALRELDRTPTRAGPREPLLEPLFPIPPLVPGSACPHFCRHCRGAGCECCGGTGAAAITPGSSFVCMVCPQSGMDGHPALKRSPLTDPKRDKRPVPKPKPSARKTRKQRRSCAWPKISTLDSVSA